MEAVSSTVAKIGGEVQDSVEGVALEVKNALSPQELPNSNSLSGGGKRRRRKSSKKSKKVKRSKKVKKSKKRRSSKRR
tara:strand:- start:994 stop:1227 length:234 start_codon:yes stop_codon:yes gene_type:complete